LYLKPIVVCRWFWCGADDGDGCVYGVDDGGHERQIPTMNFPEKQSVPERCCFPPWIALSPKLESKREQPMRKVSS